MRSLAARVVLLACVVALASSLLTSYAYTRALGATNRDQAAANLVTNAESLADVIGSGRPVRRANALLRLANRGFTVDVVAPGGTPRVPFSADDVARAASSPAPYERAAGARTWLVVGRPAADGSAVLIARPLANAVQLTPAQRRRALFGGGLGLLGGALAGLLLARGVTRPLGRLAAAARRMSAGDRALRVPAQGPREVADVAHALDGLAEALATSEERQRNFLLAVSHELRTPLTAVAGYAEALVDGALPPTEVAGAATVIRDEAGRLQRRVEDLLALARLEADDFRIVLAATDVGALLQAAVAAWGPRAVAAGVPLRLEVPPGPGPVIITDGERLRQIVDALADNALRVLPAEAPLVFACQVRPDALRVEVRDGGPGLSPEDLAVSFERGQLSERYRGSRPVGSGLGLSLVAALAQRLGGYAQAAQAPEGGVAFSVVLPATPL